MQSKPDTLLEPVYYSQSDPIQRLDNLDPKLSLEDIKTNLINTYHDLCQQLTADHYIASTTVYYQGKAITVTSSNGIISVETKDNNSDSNAPVLTLQNSYKQRVNTFSHPNFDSVAKTFIKLCNSNKVVCENNVHCVHDNKSNSTLPEITVTPPSNPSSGSAPAAPAASPLASSSSASVKAVAAAAAENLNSIRRTKIQSSIDELMSASNPADIIDKVITELERNRANIKLNAKTLKLFLNELVKIKEKKEKFSKETKIDACKTATLLQTQLCKELTSYLMNESNYDYFKKRCNSAVDSARPVLETHRGWKEVLLNIVLAIPVLPFLANITINSLEGKPTFFIARTDSHKILDEIDKDIEKMNPAK